MYPYYGNPYSDAYYRPAPDPKLVNDLVKAINGEYSAIVCYNQLAQLAPSEKEKKRILEIREDEVRHYRTFTGIYTSLTGRQPSPQMTEECAKQYAKGLRTAIEDEQDTVDFYHEVANTASDPYISESFRRAAADEQNHAVWFLYFLTGRPSS
ncbi:ferritin-like domain-containing protein [Paenibacillus sp. CC-CFT747]|nr:ferritin-like domain-containing protein [Paenibacillus sp. CC-CFT747]